MTMARESVLPLVAAPPPGIGHGIGMRPLVWPLAGAAVVIGLLVWLASLATFTLHRDRESARLEALSDLRAGQAGNWIADKIAQARFAGNSPLGEMFLLWQQHGDLAARDRLLGRLSSFHKASGGHSVLIMNDRGEILASEPAQATTASDELKSAARRAVATHTPQFTYFHGDSTPATGPRILDVVSPLYLSGTPARGLVVLRLDARDFLLPMLRQWPVPSQTAGALLIRRDGDTLVGVFGRNPHALTSPELLAAKVLRGDAPFGKAVPGLDFRGERVLGVVRPVAGTDWFLVAKMNESEVYADARRSAAWIAAAGLLALFATAAAAHWWRVRRALGLARHESTQREADHRELEQLVALRTRELAAKNQVLERTVADLEAFGASISHDLRGPLRTVNGFAMMLQRSEGQKLSEEGQRRLGRIVAGAATMDRMIEDILECSRADRMEMRFGPVDLNHMVKELVQELAPDYPQTNIAMGALPLVHADPTMARQIFANLIGNALKFSARQPRPRVEIGTQAGAGGQTVFVRDNGVGFEPGQSSRLFEPFQRLHSSEDFVGTGVGLSIVKRLIERLGGSIRAQSVPGEQTTFSLYFGPASQDRQAGSGAS